MYIADQIETMTVAELYDEMKRLGIRTTPTRIRAGIEQGVYPFAVCIRLEGPNYEIYTHLFRKWVQERIATKEAG